MNKERGFTLIELLVTLTVVAILVGAGVPALQELAMANRRAAAVNTLIGDIQLARSIASSRSRPVVLCRAPGGHCVGGNDWTDGWLAYLDEDENGSFNHTDEVLWRAQHNKNVRVLSNQDAFTFYPGYNRVGLGGTLAVCVDDDDSHARWIAISLSGRPRLEDSHPGGGAPSC